MMIDDDDDYACSMTIENVVVIPEHIVSGVSKRLEKNSMCVLSMSQFRLEVKKNSCIVKQLGSSFRIMVVIEN